MLRRPLNILIRRLQASKALQSCVVAPANQKSLNDILSSYMRGATALRRPATRYTEFYGWTGSAFLFLFQLLSLLAKRSGGIKQHENRAGCATLRERSTSTLRWHRESRLLAHGAARPDGARRHSICQWGLDYDRASDCPMQAGFAAERGVRRFDGASCFDAGAGFKPSGRI